MVMDIASGSSEERSAIIVGAGPGGLAAAILLAAAGIRVREIERPPIVSRCFLACCPRGDSVTQWQLVLYTPSRSARYSRSNGEI